MLTSRQDMWDEVDRSLIRIQDIDILPVRFYEFDHVAGRSVYPGGGCRPGPGPSRFPAPHGFFEERGRGDLSKIGAVYLSNRPLVDMPGP